MKHVRRQDDGVVRCPRDHALGYQNIVYIPHGGLVEKVAVV